MGNPEKRSIEWARTAHRDLGQIQEYLEPRSQRGWRNLLSSLFHAIDRLVEFPQIGTAAEIEGRDDYRKLVVDKYLVVYRVELDRILVLRIWDTRQDPERLKVTEENPG